MPRFFSSFFSSLFKSLLILIRVAFCALLEERRADCFASSTTLNDDALTSSLFLRDAKRALGGGGDVRLGVLKST